MNQRNYINKEKGPKVQTYWTYMSVIKINGRDFTIVSLSELFPLFL